jgi:hypothetical protein
VPNDVWLAVHLPSVQSAGGVKKVIKLGVWTELPAVRVMTTVIGLADSAAFVGVCVTIDVSTSVDGSSDVMSILVGMVEA